MAISILPVNFEIAESEPKSLLKRKLPLLFVSFEIAFKLVLGCPLLFVIFGIAFKLDCGCCHGCDPVFAFVLLVARM